MFIDSPMAAPSSFKIGEPDIPATIGCTAFLTFHPPPPCSTSQRNHLQSSDKSQAGDTAAASAIGSAGAAPSSFVGLGLLPKRLIVGIEHHIQINRKRARG